MKSSVPREWFTALILLVGILMPLGLVSAQTGLVPCFNAAGQFQAGSQFGCTLCAVTQLAQNIINFAIAAAIPISAILFAYAGFLYFSSGVSPSNITRAHGIFKNVGIGLILVLAGYLVIDLILHTVIANNFSQYFKGSGSWNSVGQCTGNRPTSATVPDWLGGIFSVNEVTTGNINSAFCPTGAAQVGPAGCACVGDTGTGVCANQHNVFVQPNGYTCQAGTFDGTTGGCQICDADGNCSIKPPTPPNPGGNSGCTIQCGAGYLCNPSSSGGSCVDNTSGKGCPPGTWGDYESGRCVNSTTGCSNGQGYDWNTGNCVASVGSCPVGDNCTAKNGQEGNVNGNAQQAANAASNHFLSASNSQCLQYVREDLCTGGFNAACVGFGQNGVGLMQATGYQALSNGVTNTGPSGYTPQPGDIVNLTFTDSNGVYHSHWEIYSSSGSWTSDFVQQNFNAYGGRPTVNYTIYRHP